MNDKKKLTLADITRMYNSVRAAAQNDSAQQFAAEATWEDYRPEMRLIRNDGSAYSVYLMTGHYSLPDWVATQARQMARAAALHPFVRS